MDDLFLDQTSFEVEWTSNDFISDLVYDISFSTDLENWTPVMTGVTASPLSLTTKKIITTSQMPQKKNYFIRIGARRLPLL